MAGWAQAGGVPAVWSGPAGQQPARGRGCRRRRRPWCQTCGSWFSLRSTLCHKVDSALWRKVKGWAAELCDVKSGGEPLDRINLADAVIAHAERFAIDK